MPASDGSDSVVENETLGLRSTSDVSNVELIDGWVILKVFTQVKVLFEPMC